MSTNYQDPKRLVKDFYTVLLTIAADPKDVRLLDDQYGTRVNLGNATLATTIRTSGRHGKSWFGVWTGARNRRDEMSLLKDVKDSDMKALVTEVYTNVTERDRRAKQHQERSENVKELLDGAAIFLKMPYLKLSREGTVLKITVMTRPEYDWSAHELSLALEVRPHSSHQSRRG